MAAEVVRLPLPEPEPDSCFKCQHAYHGVNGTICGQFMEFIVNESAAEDCESYEP